MIPRSRHLVVVLAVLLPASFPAAAQEAGAAASGEQESCPPPAALIDTLRPPLSHARYLADDALRGREVASPGARCAADYIAARFRELGLEPGGTRGEGWFRPFPVRVGSRLGEGNALALGDEEYTLRDGWIPFGFSGSGRVEAPGVYGGHGFNRPGEGDAGYARAEVEGRVVVVEAGDPASPPGRTTRSDPHFKATVAQGRGAAGIVVLLGEGAPLPSPDGELRPLLEIPAVAVRGTAAEALRRAAREGRTIRVATSVEERTAGARNVAAILRGSEPAFRDQAVVVGAHFDHLGLGGRGSLAPAMTGAIHNGADDNASGVAVLLETARRLATAPEPPARTVVFVAFAGEERGLLGSSRYVAHPAIPMERTAAMINLDMVGRLRDDRLTVMGTGTAKEWPGILERANAALEAPLTVDTVADGFGPSDHASFYGEGVPVLHFFTDAHPDYHRPEDDWQKLNARGMERIADLVVAAVREVGGPRAVTAIAGVGDPHGGRAFPEREAEEGENPSPGYGPYLGTIPDFTPIDHGVRLTGVREGSPADEAGIRGGDVVVGFGGREIGDLYAYTYALRAHSPGDTVEIEVLRDGERVTLEAVLEHR